jgi:undecaprenyl diphosphate synthase
VATRPSVGLGSIPEEGLRTLSALGLKPEQCPRHIAIIMLGHRQGIRSVRAVVEEACRLGLDQLTLYCLSVENWKRPERELRFLLRLLRHFLVIEQARLMEQNVRLTMIGGREELPPDVLAELDRTVALTAGNTGLTLCLAINYGGRTEIVQAARRIAEAARAGRLDPQRLDESGFAEYLSTAGRPDPDLLIRTAGELRISNFLLWQISYAELWVTDVLWPDFRANHLHEAIRAFAGRNRKFGGLPGQPPAPPS